MTGRFVAREKSRAFALRVVKLCRLLQERDREYVLSRQLLLQQRHQVRVARAAPTDIKLTCFRCRLLQALGNGDGRQHGQRGLHVSCRHARYMLKMH